MKIILLTSLLWGCSTAHYEQSADLESYGAIADKQDLVPGMVEDLIIDYTSEIDLSPYPTNSLSFDFLDGDADSEIGASIITLEDALDLGFRHSREYQTQKERLYLEALALTFDRYRYTPVFSAVSGGDYQWDAADQFVADMQALTGMSALSTSESVATSSNLGGRVLLRSGGAIALNLTNNFTRFLTGDVSEASATALIGSFTQPLLRDFGAQVETEVLIQAERDLLYQLRSFTRFRKTFAVRIASAYYSVLLNREIAKNNLAGLVANNLSLEREQAFRAEGLRTLLQVGRLEESALQLDRRWASSIARYLSSRDNLKILLGLDADINIMLDDNEMRLIAETGMEDVDINLELAMETALQTRLDLYTQLDLVQDSARKIRVAANEFDPALDFSFNVNVPDSASGNFGELDFENAVYRAGLDLELPLDTKNDRNNYRRTLIAYEASTRAYVAAVDAIKLNVLDAWRAMEVARKSYEINLASVRINERRVEEAELRAELGLGDIQDTVDSQNDLTAAQTQLSSSIVDHNIAKLEFWRDIGLLYINDEGLFEEGIDEPQ